MKAALSALAIVLMAIAPACIWSDDAGEEPPQATQLQVDTDAEPPRATQHPTATYYEPPETTPPPGNASATPLETSEPTTPPEERIEESPLTTWDASGVEAFAGEGFPGRLRISDGCVLVLSDLQDMKILPVWPEPASWNVSAQSIELINLKTGGRNIELQVDDRIELGGVMRSELYPLFVRPPTSDCTARADAIVIVYDVLLVSQY